MKCKHEISIGSETHNGCNNHAKLVLRTGVVSSEFCRNKCPYRVEVSEGLGDTVAKVLSSVGITKERVSAVVGSDCGCTGRQDALNKIVRYDTTGPQIVCLDNATRHLLYRVYPMNRNDAWQWNLEQLAQRWQMFNGKRILAIGYDSKSVMPDAVIQYARILGMEFDVVIRKRNVPNLREVVTFLPMMDALLDHDIKPDELVFTAHSKGAQYSDRSDHNVWWTQCMYEACLDYWPLVKASLMRFMFCGIFRRYGAFPNKYRWDYSGTFYWFRLADILQRDWRNIDQFFAGTESWPGQVADIHESSCLFADNCGDLYSAEHWRDNVLPAWEKWKAANAAQRRVA